MTMEAVNSLGHTILRVTKLEDILSVDQIKSLAKFGYTFRVNGKPVTPENAYAEAVGAAIRERINNNGQ